MKGRSGMATCTLRRPPNNWIDNNMINIIGGQKLLGMVNVKALKGSRAFELQCSNRSKKLKEERLER